MEGLIWEVIAGRTNRGVGKAETNGAIKQVCTVGKRSLIRGKLGDDAGHTSQTYRNCRVGSWGVYPPTATLGRRLFPEATRAGSFCSSLWLPGKMMQMH